jgi:hypothetical protein
VADRNEFITIAQARQRLPAWVRPSTIRRWCESGTYGVVACKTAGRWLIDPETLPVIEESLHVFEKDGSRFRYESK